MSLSRMLPYLRMLLALSALAITLDARAQAAGGPEANIAKILEQRMPEITIVGVTKTIYDGMYEVRTDDPEIFYTDEGVNYIFIGTVRDGHNPEHNLTEERLQQITAINYGDLPFQASFKIVRGTGRRQIAYFSDPNCPYCKALEKELMQLSDITINVFLYPILTADSAPKARAIWCSPDRGKAWLDWMLAGVAPPQPAASCDTQDVDKNLAFGHKIRVNSVPTLVFPNGVRVAGMRPAAALSKMLTEANAAGAIKSAGVTGAAADSAK
jgi:thiol:disulfide interchange protein DsbC